MVSSDVTLHQLHQILQVVMGWTNNHLHKYRTQNTYYGIPVGGLGAFRKNEKKVRLNDVLRNPKDRMIYEYDFGDGWEHDIVLEKVEIAQEAEKYPIVLKGKRACPPEDIGGVWGYYHFLEVIANPEHPEYKDMVEWIGGAFDPIEFDVAAVNANIQKKGRLTSA